MSASAFEEELERLSVEDIINVVLMRAAFEDVEMIDGLLRDFLNEKFKKDPSLKCEFIAYAQKRARKGKRDG